MGSIDWFSPTQQSLRTHQQPRTAHKKQHLPVPTANGTQPPSPQQVTAPVHPFKTPLLATPQVHTDTSRARGGEGGDWQTVKSKQTRIHVRQTNGETHTPKHTHASTNRHSQHTQPPQTNTTYRGHNSGVGWGWGVRSLGVRARRVPCHSYGQGGGRHPVLEPGFLI